MEVEFTYNMQLRQADVKNNQGKEKKKKIVKIKEQKYKRLNKAR